MTQAGGLGTQTDVMAQAAQHVATVRSDIDAQLAALRTRLQTVPDVWSGQAGQAFVVALTQCEAESRKLAGALGGIGDQLRASGQAYAAAESDLHQQVLREAGTAQTGISTALKGQ
ncbi:MAG: WXG100 family type VII secretion target [Pseudonocardia sp.]|nr:WXG100 family type VII secretion target [Pseudonocardia sp.]